MVSLVDLWLPIVLSAVAVFIASSIIWMALPIHRHDYKDPGSREDPLLAVLRAQSFAPGVYAVPWCMGKTKDLAAIEKFKSGPWAMLTVMPKAPNMGKTLGLWFVHLVIIAAVVAYLVSHAGLPAGAPFLAVFRFASTAALLAHAGYALPMCIWHCQPWQQLTGRLFDGVVYSLLTALAFASLWPGATAAA